MTGGFFRTLYLYHRPGSMLCAGDPFENLTSKMIKGFKNEHQKKACKNGLRTARSGTDASLCAVLKARTAAAKTACEVCWEAPTVKCERYLNALCLL